MTSGRPTPPPLPAGSTPVGAEGVAATPMELGGGSFLSFAGIVEGCLVSRAAGESAVEDAIREINGLRWFADGRDLAALEWEGSRYSIWFREDSVLADSIPADLHGALLAPLQRVVAASTPAGLESTLRWRHTEGSQVTECLVAPVGQGVPQLRAVQRSRPMDEGDLLAARTPKAGGQIRWRSWSAIASLVALVLLVSRYQRTWGAPDSSDLLVDPAGFAGRLKVEWAPDSWPEGPRYRLMVSSEPPGAAEPPGLVDVALFGAAGHLLESTRVQLGEGPSIAEFAVGRAARSIRLLEPVLSPKDPQRSAPGVR